MPVAELTVGTRLGPEPGGGFRYEVQRTLGAGGFGITYEVEDRRLHGRAVVKELACADFAWRDTDTGVLRPARGMAADLRRLQSKFLREARLLNRLRSPHIVRVRDVWEERGTAYYAMDYVDSIGALETRPVDDALSPAEWASTEARLRQLIDALAEVHGAGMIHGDVKPENVLVDRRLGVVLIDFGTAKPDEELGNTVTSLAFTRGYAAPELMNPMRMSEAGPWSDWYAWGMVAWGMVGPHPVRPDRPVDALQRGQGDDPYTRAADLLVARHVPVEWAAAIAACIELQPSARPGSAEELRRAIDDPDGWRSWREVKTEHPAPPTKTTPALRAGTVREPWAPARGAEVATADTVAAPTGEPPISTPSPRNGLRVAAAGALLAATAVLAWLAVGTSDPAPGPSPNPLVPGSGGSAIGALCDVATPCDGSGVCFDARCTDPGAVGEDGLAAWAATIRAWNEHEMKTYIGSYLDPISCFQGREAMPRVELERSRRHHFVAVLDAHYEVISQEVVDVTSGRVIVRDESWLVVDGERRKRHTRVLDLRWISGRWRIAGETSIASRGCLTQWLGGP